MDANTFKPGDTVRLRCGGPAMVISHRAVPLPAMPGVLDLSPPAPTGWVVLWTIQNALRSAVIEDIALELVPPVATAPA